MAVSRQTTSPIFDVIWIHLAGAAILGILAILSEGVSLHDEIGHYLISLNAWQHPAYLLDLWGRPVNSLIYFPGAGLGWFGASITSIALTFYAAVLTTRIAGKLAAGVVIPVALCFWLQPWILEFGYGIHTQLPFMLIFLAGINAFLEDADGRAAFLWGLLPLIRHEGIILMGLAVLYLIIRRQYLLIVLPLVPLLVYNLIHIAVTGSWPFAIYLDAQPTAIYGQGSWLHFLPRAGGRIGLTVASLAAVGLYLAIKEKQSKQLLVTLPFMIYALAHITIFRFGLFASGGYAIFLLPVAPIFAIMAGRGFQRLRQHLTTAKVAYPAITLALLMQLFFVGFFSAPKAIDQEGLALREAAEWLQEKNVDAEDIYAAHVWFYYFYPLPAALDRNWEKIPPASALPTKSWFVWDNHYSPRLPETPADSDFGQWTEQARFSDSLVVIYHKSP